MNYSASNPNRRILIVDDSQTIQHDFRVVLSPQSPNEILASKEAELFEETSATATSIRYELDCAEQGEVGVELVEQSIKENNPYALAFVDVRMPPGMDGIETAERMFQLDSHLHIVLCTAYSDHSWKKIIDRLGQTDRLLILKKPFDSIEVRQMALAMTCKWTQQLLNEQKREEIQHWLDELTQLVQSARDGELKDTPVNASLQQ